MGKSYDTGATQEQINQFNNKPLVNVACSWAENNAVEMISNDGHKIFKINRVSPEQRSQIGFYGHKWYSENGKFCVVYSSIDTCETKSKCEENKKLGIDAKKRLYNLITNKQLDIDVKDMKKFIKHEFHNNCYLIYLKCYDFDKYGRVLGDIFKDENDTISYSSILVKERLAYIYGGKTKLTENDQLQLLKP